MNDQATFSSRDLDFTSRGNCAGMNPDLFFPPDGTPVGREARDACEACDVRLPCLSWALKHENHGFWGGTTPDERRAMRRKGRK